SAAPLDYALEYGDFSQRLSEQASWLIALRREGYEQFGSVGFPTTHDEDWRFTNVSAIAKSRFEIARHASEISAADVEAVDIYAFDSRLVFVNGRFSAELSHISKLDGVTIGSLAEQIASGNAEVQEHLGKYLNFQRDAFAALNTAFIEDGAFVH